MGFDIKTIFDIAKDLGYLTGEENNLKRFECIEFEGISSRDYESHCFDVDEKTFIDLTKEKPSPLDKSYFNEGLFRYYPFEGLSSLTENNKKYKVKIILEEIK